MWEAHCASSRWDALLVPNRARSSLRLSLRRIVISLPSYLGPAARLAVMSETSQHCAESAGLAYGTKQTRSGRC